MDSSILNRIKHNETRDLVGTEQMWAGVALQTGLPPVFKPPSLNLPALQQLALNVHVKHSDLT